MTGSVSTAGPDTCPACGSDNYRVVHQSIEGDPEMECNEAGCGVRWWPAHEGVVLDPLPWDHQPEIERERRAG